MRVRPDSTTDAPTRRRRSRPRSPAGVRSRRRAISAETGIDELREEVDTLIVIPNDRLLQISDRNVSVMDAFRQADQVLLQLSLIHI